MIFLIYFLIGLIVLYVKRKELSGEELPAKIAGVVAFTVLWPIVIIVYFFEDK